MGDSGEKGKSFDTAHQNKWNVRYAKEWLIEPDVVATLSQDKDLELANQMQIDFEKNRDGDGEKKSFKIRWDKFDTNYDEVSKEEEREEAEEALTALTGSVSY